MNIFTIARAEIKMFWIPVCDFLCTFNIYELICHLMDSTVRFFAQKIKNT